MYKVGDKFIIEIGGEYPQNPFEDGENGKAPTILYKIKGFNSLVFDENGLGKFEKYDENAGYEKGLSDAWEAAKKICLSPYDGGIEADVIKEIFGMTHDIVMEKSTPQEAVDRLKEWEEKHDIKVGDVVTFENKNGKFLVTECLDGVLHCIDSEMTTYARKYDEVAKTGKRIDLSELLNGLEEKDV